MKKILFVSILSCFVFFLTSQMSAAIAVEPESTQTSFSYNVTFQRVIDYYDYYMEVCIDAYCYGGHTGEGVAIASVEYDHVMLDNDYDTGGFVSVWAHAGNYQNPQSIFPDSSKRRALWSIVDRGVDLLNG